MPPAQGNRVPTLQQEQEVRMGVPFGVAVEIESASGQGSRFIIRLPLGEWMPLLPISSLRDPKHDAG